MRPVCPWHQVGQILVTSWRSKQTFQFQRPLTEKKKKKSFRIELWQVISNPSSYIATSKLRLKGSPLWFGLGLLRNKEGFIRVEQTGKEQGHRLAVNKLVWPSFHKAQRKGTLCWWRCCCHEPSMAAIRFVCACVHLIYLSVNGKRVTMRRLTFGVLLCDFH